MASIADRIKDRVLKKTNTGRITRNRPAQKQKLQFVQVVINQQRPKKKGTVGDDDDEDEDEDDNGEDNGDSNPDPKKPMSLRKCDFCLRDPIGKQMCKQRHCDYRKGWKANYIECSNCADYRSQNPGSEHKCQPPQAANAAWRKYGVADPVDYRPPTCDQCLNMTRTHNQCNVDSTLGYGCTMTKMCRDGHCTINGQALEARPNPRVDTAGWLRGECHVCHNKTKKGRINAGCSWLRDRSTWDQACSYCQTHNLTCISGVRVVANPQTLALPQTWAANLQTFDKGFIECQKTNPTRRMCKRCWQDDHDHCRADAGSYFYSCSRCAQLGVDCIDAEDDTSYPIFDLARVGIGGYMPFVECKCCREAGRNCDLQRPCDSCVKHGDQCDDWKGATVKECIKGRLDPPPGPLYYLALGYGVGGVDDPKDGSAIEHWVGPAANIYAVPENQNRPFIATMGVQLRSMMSPPGAPPHGDAAQGGRVSGRASDITREQIVEWIKDSWPEAAPMNQLAHYPRRVAAVRQKMQDIRDGKIVSALFADFPNGGEGEGEVAGDDDDNENVNENVNDNGNEIGNENDNGASSGDAPAAPAAPLFDTSAPDWLSTFINPDMLDDDGGAPPTLPGQSWIDFDFDVVAPSGQMPADLQFGPFEVFPIDPNLMPMDIDQDVDQAMQIDSPSSLEDAEFIDHNPPSIVQEEDMNIPLFLTTPAPYTFVPGYPIQQTRPPFFNVLGLLPEQVKSYAPSHEGACAELRNDRRCNNPVAQDSICQCFLHRDHDGVKHICDDCCELSAAETKDTVVTSQQMEAMRAYLCTDCTAQVSYSVAEVSRRRLVGAVNIWGDCRGSYYTRTELEMETPLGRINFRGPAGYLTGCSCAAKLFDQRLCRSHRLLFGQLVVSQVAKMREWCVRHFGRNVCPGCLVDKAPDEANLAGDVFESDGLRAWVCLACGDWVVNQDCRV